jgi:hypothetical protein
MGFAILRKSKLDSVLGLDSDWILGGDAVH